MVEPIKKKKQQQQQQYHHHLVNLVIIEHRRSNVPLLRTSFLDKTLRPYDTCHHDNQDDQVNQLEYILHYLCSYSSEL